MPERIADIDIQPESDVLNALALSQEDFYTALETALERLDGKPTAELPRPTNIPIWVNGQEHRLGELAKIAVSLRTRS